MAETQLTLGQMRVRVTFNPSEDKNITMLKTAAANFIDACEVLKDPPALGNERNRSLAIAQTHMEDACMHAVKGATAPTTREAATDTAKN